MKTIYIKTTRVCCIIFFLLFSQSGYSKFIYYTFRQQCRLANEIYLGKVISIRDSTYQLKEPFYGVTHLTKTYVKVKTLHTWKGKPADTIVFTFDDLIACCANRFIKGQNFIVYVTNQSVDFCSGRTAELRNNKDRQRLNRKYLRRKYESA